MNKATRVLMIDDEPAVCRFLRTGLEPLGYEVKEVATGSEGLNAVAEFKPDIVILDLGLPDIGGFEVLKKLREWSKVPVVVLTVRDSEHDKVNLLEAGADDYLTKPFSLPELKARMKVALRHRQALEIESPILALGPLEIDFSLHTVKKDGMLIKLTATEFEMLRLLAQAQGRIVTQQSLLLEIWGPNSSENFHYLRIYIGNLRKKLEVDPSHPTLIITESGVGYRINSLPK